MITRITEIEIEAFRAIRAVRTLAWCEPGGRPLERVVLAGPNGSGKTSVLEAILLAFGRESLIVRDLPPAKRSDHWRVELPPGARIALKFRTYANFFDRVADRATEWKIVRTAERWELWGASGEVLATEPGQVRRRLADIPVEYFTSWRAPSLPGGLQPTTGGRAPDDNEANRLRRIKQRIINERARRAIAREPSPAQDDRWLAGLNAVWGAFHGDGSTIEADIVDPSGDEPVFDLFVFDGAQRRCSIDQISSGELELVTLAGTLLLAGFDGVLLVDEPELHLHPEWQTRLIDVLTKVASTSQLVVATHASAPWDQVYSFERFFLAPPGDPRA